ncbi:SDR family oxidoreductase [Mycobacterium sp. E740]|uniref:SDR family oxidoreductase n=1 Tax=Mycobacterium sp. E740 TaxID=1834149 RepID=UPI0008023E09|nr:SDR family oxidoreductase [Mycobacterium sp. E740]OBI78056.1 NmrA family transcriptional regulator [Mycobacterium sp. E740]
MKIVVVGGTGRVGSIVVRHLIDRGHQAIAAAPSTGVDTVSGRGLADVLDGASTVVDVSNSPVLDDSARAFFEASTTNLLAAEAAAGVSHHVALSVVGTAQLAERSGYFAAKLMQEQLLATGAIPHSIVHATQFFEFVATIADSATVDGSVRLPPAFIQPIAAADVAEFVASVAVGPPTRGIVEAAGPQRYRMPELVRTALTADGDPRAVVSDSTATYWGTAIAEDVLVPAEGAWLGTRHFEDWLIASAATG